MKNKIYLTTSSILLAINITGCTLLPYEETFICNKGLNSGSCQSVSENYRDTFVDKNSIPLTLKQKEVLIAIAKEGKAKAINSTHFIQKHQLRSASSVQSAVKYLIDKDLITVESNIYSVYDRFFAIWIKKSF